MNDSTITPSFSQIELKLFARAATCKHDTFDKFGFCTNCTLDKQGIQFLTELMKSKN